MTSVQDNPYLPPAASPTRAPTSAAKLLWWIYLVPRGAWSALGVFVAVATLSPWQALSHALDVVCVAGLFFHLRGMRVARAGLWQALLGLFLAKYVAVNAIHIDRAYEFDVIPWRPLVQQALLVVPLAIGVWRYANRRAFWQDG